MKLERRPGYCLLVGGPVPPGSAAITIGRLITVRASSADDEQLLRHELVHVGQWHDEGAVGFVVRYVGSYLQARLAGLSHREAYRQIPFEVEARQVGGPETSRGERPIPAGGAPAVGSQRPLPPV